MFLIDTMVVSELVKPAGRQNPSVKSWFKDRPPQDLYLSVVAVAEIHRGIVGQRKRNPLFAAKLENWLDATIDDFGARILPVTVEIARRWGDLNAAAGNRNLDNAIAATALEHGLAVVTRNVAHFKPTEVATVDPFKD